MVQRSPETIRELEPFKRPTPPAGSPRSCSRTLGAALLAGTVAVTATTRAGAVQDAAQDTAGNVFHDGSTLAWEGDGLMRFVALYGDPYTPGPFAFRIETRAGFEMAPHTHPVVEHLTVLSGTLHLGIGEVADREKGTAYGPGSYIAIGAGVAAYFWSEETTVLQVHGIGPFTTEYVEAEGAAPLAREPVAATGTDRPESGGSLEGPRIVELASGVDAVLQAVSPVSLEVVWVSGHQGVILRTLDGGAGWERTNAPARDTLQFRDIHAFSAERAAAMSSGTGSDSRIYRTADGGESWELAFEMDHPEGFLDCLDFWDDEHGFAYGDSFDGVPYVLLTADGGTSWRRAPRAGLPAANEGEGGFAASGTCARATGDGTGWIGTGAGGSARVLKTTDYGATWNATDVDVARGASAGVYTLAVDPALASGTGGWIMALGGDYAADSVLPNVAVSADDGDSWRSGESAPIAGAVYGSAFAHNEEGAVVVAVSPSGAAITTSMAAAWSELEDVRAWAVEAVPGERVFWAAGADGRIWRIEF